MRKYVKIASMFIFLVLLNFGNAMYNGGSMWVYPLTGSFLVATLWHSTIQAVYQWETRDLRKAPDDATDTPHP